MLSSPHPRKFLAYITFLCILMSGCLLHAKPPDKLKINSVELRYIHENEFKRISEYFTGKENKGGDTILRSDDHSRTGMYFIIRLNQPINSLPRFTQIVIQYIRSDNSLEQKKIYALEPEGCYSREIYLGLTGDDWTSSPPPPSPLKIVAHSIQIEDLQGTPVTSKDSFLWRNPKNN